MDRCLNCHGNYVDEAGVCGRCGYDHEMGVNHHGEKIYDCSSVGRAGIKPALKVVRNGEPKRE